MPRTTSSLLVMQAWPVSRSPMARTTWRACHAWRRLPRCIPWLSFGFGLLKTARHQVVRYRVRDCFAAVERTELGDYVADVEVHGAFGNCELERDVAARHAACRERETFAFARRQVTRAFP